MSNSLSIILIQIILRGTEVIIDLHNVKKIKQDQQQRNKYFRISTARKTMMEEQFFSFVL